MPFFDKERQEYERKLARSGLSEANKNRARGMWLEERRALRAETRALRAATVKSEELAAQRGSKKRTAAGNLGAFALHATDAALFNRLANVGDLTPDEPSAGAMLGSAFGPIGSLAAWKMRGAQPSEGGERLRTALEVSGETNPIASGAGDIAGLFGPGPAGLAARGAGALGIRGLEAGLRRVAPKLLNPEAPYLARATRHVLSALTSGAAGVASFEVPSKWNAEDPTYAISETFSMLWSPTFLGTSAALGGAAARFGGKMADPKVEREVRSWVDRMRRFGYRPSPDVLTDSREMQMTIRTIAHAPGGAALVQDHLNRVVYPALRASLDDLTGAPPPREAVRGHAAAAVRRLRGSPDPGGAKSPVTLLRQGTEAAAMAQEGDRLISPTTMQGLRDGLAQILRKEGRSILREGRGTRWESELRRFRAITKAHIQRGETFHARGLEELRQTTAGIAAYKNVLNPGDPNLSARARREAGAFYDLVVSAQAAETPLLRRAEQAASGLRRIEDALQSVPYHHIDDATVAAMVTGKGALQRIAALENQGLPGELQTIRGWYSARLVEEFADPRTGLVDYGKLVKFTQRGGMFNSQIMDRLMPGVRANLLLSGRGSDRLRKGILAAEGSTTVGYAARYSRPLAIVATAGTFVANPYYGVAALLGGAGYRAFLKSLVTGWLGEEISGIALGQAPNLGVLQNVAQRTPGTPIVNEVGGALAEALQRAGLNTGAAPQAPAPEAAP